MAIHRSAIRTLVVDDNEDVRQLVAAILVERGHKIQVADGGQAAIEVLQRDTPDVMVLDIMMPEVDGFTVLKKMRELNLKTRPRVLILTAKTAEADWLQGYRLGADHYLTKPFTAAELVEALNGLLRMTPDQLRQKRAQELEKAQLLSKLENFGL